MIRVDEYKEIEELIDGYITESKIQIEKLRNDVDQISADLDQCKEDCEKALLGKDEKKYSYLKAKREMLSVRLDQAQNDLTKLETSKAIPEETFTDLTNRITAIQRSAHRKCKTGIADQYNNCKSLRKEAEVKIAEGNRVLHKLNEELGHIQNAGNYYIVGVELEMMLRGMRDAISRFYAGTGITIT